MSTAQSIITQALGFSLANDQGQTLLAQDTSESLGVLNRLLAQVYTLASLPKPTGYDVDHAAFVRTTTVTLATPATTAVAFPATFVRLMSLTDAGGDEVAQVSVADVRARLAETPPAVIVADRTIRSAGRVGDPTDASVLTVDGYYLPGTLTAASDTIGASSPTDPTTSSWPVAGDAFLAASLALYWCRKDGTRDPAEQQSLTAEVGTAAAILGGIIGVSAAKLTALDVDA